MMATSEPMTDAQLAAIRQRLARITEPPWSYDQPYTAWQIYSVPRRLRRDDVDDPTHPDHWEHIAGTVATTADAVFISHAPDDLRALLAEVERLRTQVGALPVSVRASAPTDGAER